MFSRAGRLVSRFGPAVLLPPAAFAVHQLRYLLTYGSDTGVELRETGHSYLHSVVPWLVCLVALAAGCFLRKPGAEGADVSAWIHGLVRVAMADLHRGLGGDLRLSGVAGGDLRDRASRWIRRGVRIRRLVGDPGLRLHRSGARGDLPRSAMAGPEDRMSSPAPNEAVANAEAWAPVALAGGWSSRGPPA
jgi:hypothetical protein